MSGEGGVGLRSRKRGSKIVRVHAESMRVNRLTFSRLTGYVMTIAVAERLRLAIAMKAVCKGTGAKAGPMPFSGQCR